jgi:5'-3' exonuclease
MILLDYSAVAIASMMIAMKKDGERLTEQFALHMILNSIRKSYKQHKNDFGTMVICCDSSKNWRKDIFPLYKYKRRKDKKDSGVEWGLIYNCLNFVKEELRSGFPYLVIEENGCEADDIIGTLARYATDISKPTVIISNDKDFVQLHSKYVCQWRPIEQAFVRNVDPSKFLKELIIRGDTEDGVPNIKSPDDIFTIEGKRQSPIYTKDIDKWLEDDDNTFLEENELWKRNYERNRALIDLTMTPKNNEVCIIIAFEHGRQRANKPKMTKFFMKHRLRYLHKKINDFI